MNTIYHIQNLKGGYHQKTIIQDVSFKMESGEFLGIIGPNGSGKSTLLKLLTKVLHPQAGTILFEEKDITHIPLKNFCQKVAFVPQETTISFSFTVWEIALLGRIPHLERFALETKKDFSIAEKALLQTNTLALKERKIDEISAGERQRVIIAKALTQEPILLMLDEPTSHLDIKYQISILNLLEDLNQKTGLTIIIVLHDLNLASRYCQKLLMLNQGKIITKGTPQEVITSEQIEKVYQTKINIQKDIKTGKPYLTLL